MSGALSSVIFLDDFTCLKQYFSIDKIFSLEASVGDTSGGYTWLLPPCDVGVIKSLNGGTPK